MKKINITGYKYGRLTVINHIDKKHGKKRERMVLCKCECGNLTEKTITALRSGKAKSCGCFQRESRYVENRKSHGMSSHELAATWYGMIKRCYHVSFRGYEHYGAIGIEVCPRWKNDISLFISDVEKTLGKRPKGYSLDRINPYDDYHPYNVRWADDSTQNLNKRRSNNTGEDYIFMTSDKYRVSMNREGNIRSSFLFNKLKNAIELRDMWLEELDSNYDEWVKNTINNNYQRTTIRGILDIDDYKYIHKRNNNCFEVGMTKEKQRRRATIKTLEDAIKIRDKWLLEYFNNPDKWIEDTVNKTYKRE